jgi:opacity protein-like surface antigen
MRKFAAALTLLVVPTVVAAQDADRTVAGGGITAAGWQGRVDARAASQGKTVNDSKFALSGGKLQLAIGPAATYWNESLRGTGNYEVKATFTENKHNPGHPHSYGVVFAGSDLGSDATQKYAYCIVYADGKYAAKFFNGTKVSNLADRTESAAIKKAVNGVATNEVGWRVRGDKASCVINGTEVQSWDKAALVGPDKLASLDGIAGIRVTHNVDLTVTPPTISK